MSIERLVCKLVKQHWDVLYPGGSAPKSLIFLKVAGKTSPNAAIIAMILDSYSKHPVAVAKIPRNPQITAGIDNEYNAMLNLEESISDTSILDHIPFKGILDESHGVKILLQAAEEGTPMLRRMISQESVEVLYNVILPWMFEFHAHGAKKISLTGDILHEFIKEPIALFYKKFNIIALKTLSDESKQYLTELPGKVKGCSLKICRQHGDFNAHNILIDVEYDNSINFSLIDWEDYNSRQLPIHDLNHFFTSNSHLLNNKMRPEDSYLKYVIEKNWYHDLYIKSINNYEKHGIVDRDLFLRLTPLYMIQICLRLSEVQRAQKHTAITWIKRMNSFILSYLM